VETSRLPIKYLAADLQATAWFHDPDPQKPRPGLRQTAAKPHISKQHTSNSYACTLIREIQPLAIRSSHTKLTWGDFNSIHPRILNDAGCRTYELRSSHSYSRSDPKATKKKKTTTILININHIN
jgi:hypothetical protein